MGLTVANLLAARQVPVVLVEQHASTSDEAKAISLADESLRALAPAGLAEEVLDIVVPGTGTRYFDRRGRVLFHAGGPQSHPFGYPFKNQFAQPELERLLLRSLRGRPSADVRFATELVGLTGHPDRVTARIRSAGTTTELAVSWALGCDGGRSRVRELRGIDMSGTSHRDVWMVVDTVGDHHDQRYGMHYGTPDRPTVVVPGRDGRCRYEFLLRPGEGERNTVPDIATVRTLLAPFRQIRPEQIERATNYTFNALVADRWRDGRCLLLGDAAHMMPPFAGQGLNSGVRDAANLAWKIEHVWRGQAGEQLLDTYEQERRPHAEAMVRFSERLGEVMMTTRPGRARARDLAARVTLLTPAGRRFLTQMHFLPASAHRAGLVAGRHPLVGRPLPQPPVLVAPGLRTAMLDEVLGSGWALLGIDVTDADWARFTDHVWAKVWGSPHADLRRVGIVLDDRLPRATDGRTTVADADGRLDAALRSARGRLVLVRPDRYVAAVVAPGDEQALAARLHDLLTPQALLPRPAHRPGAGQARGTPSG